MNTYQTKLYEQLMTLVETNDAFYHADRALGNQVYRLFNYRLASYTNFLLPGALECRGIMFNITHDEPGLLGADGYAGVELASMPMEKFFNLNENPSTMDLDLSTMVDAELKADGSLISTYMHDLGYAWPDTESELRLKTKGSIESDQCVAAMKYLDCDENDSYRIALMNLTRMDYTINCEWCAPDNRIVLGYMEPVLTVLNVRRNNDGGYVDLFSPSALGNPAWDVLREHHIDKVTVEDPVQWVADIPDMVDIEGYVITLESGQRIKVKTEWYLVQHRAKDSINSDRRLFEAVLAEATDDLRSMFYYDELICKRIGEMEEFVAKHYNHLVETVETFYETNKHFVDDVDEGRKQYAIKGQKELEKMHFGLAMSLFLGRDVNYKEFMAKHWKEYGLKDLEKDDE